MRVFLESFGINFPSCVLEKSAIDIPYQRLLKTWKYNRIHSLHFSGGMHPGILHTIAYINKGFAYNCLYIDMETIFLKTVSYACEFSRFKRLLILYSSRKSHEV